jgi:hypothetical protein
MNKRFNNCLRAPSGFIDPINLFFYTHSIGNKDLDFLTLNHEVSGHGIHGIDKMISLLILSSKNKDDYVDSIRNILEALAYDEDIRNIKKEKIDPSLIDILKKRPNFEDIQEISNGVADIIELAHVNTGVTLSHREIYKIILHYWRIPFLDNILKKDPRKITPFETIEEINNILSRSNKETTDRELLIQLREALLKKKFKLFGYFDYPLDFLPFGLELIMCFELFNESSKERRREIFTHLLNALTLNASRGIVLPYDATDEIYLQMLTIKMKYKSKDIELKTPLYVFFPPLLVYFLFEEQDLSFLKSDLSNCGFNYHFSKIALELNKQKTSKKHKKKTNLQDGIFKQVDEVLSSFILTHEACDLISVYLLNFSGFLLSSMIREQVPIELRYHIDPNQRQVIGPSSGSIKLTTPDGYKEIVDSFDSRTKEKHMEILRYFFLPEPQMQEIKNNLQKTASKTELLQLKNITLEKNTELIATLPFDINTINNIEKCYEKVFEKKGDIFGFIINFPKIYKEFNEILHETASEYFCPDELCSESILNARKGIIDFKSTDHKSTEQNIKVKYFEKKYPNFHIVDAFYNP